MVHGWKDLLLNVLKAFKIFVTIPITSCLCEKTLFIQSFIKNQTEEYFESRSTVYELSVSSKNWQKL